MKFLRKYKSDTWDKGNYLTRFWEYYYECPECNGKGCEECEWKGEILIYR